MQRLLWFLTFALASIVPASGAEYAFVVDFSAEFVDTYRIDPATGALSIVGGIRTGKGPVSVALHPGGRYAYVANSASSTISAYMIDPTGLLGEIPGSPFKTFFGINRITVDPTGRYAYAAIIGNPGAVSAYRIDANTGALTPAPGSPFPAGNFPESVAVDPGGRFVYAANHDGNSVSGYVIDDGTGALTEMSGSPFSAGLGPQNVTVDPTGKFVYVANQSNSDVSAYTINGATGVLTPVPGSPFTPRRQFGCFALAVDPAGKFLYVANNGSDNVSTYAINATTGALAEIPGSPVPTEGGPRSISIEPTGAFVYVANGSGSISAYARIGTTGALTPVVGSPFSNPTFLVAPVSIATGPRPLPDLTIAKSHAGTFTQGQSGATYTIMVNNLGVGPTSGAVTVTDTVPAGLTAAAIAGTGWSCTQPSGPCTRNDALAASSSYPPLTLTVSVSPTAPSSVTNTASVSGGGEMNTANNTASDPTTIRSISATPPTVDSVTPNSSTSSSQTFTFQYSSVNGYSYLNAVYALINASLSIPNGCVAVYVPSTNSIYLANDAGSGVTGPLTPGSAGTLSNSQCTINGTGSSASGAGNALSLVLSIASKPVFKGLKTIYGYAADNGGLTSNWTQLGTWTPNPVSGTSPTADSVTPNNGAGLSQTFVYKYSSANGYTYINYTYALINGSLSAANGCLALYVENTNSLYLYNDAGNSITGPITPGGPGSLSNSQCTINGPGSSASGSGNTLTLSLATSFNTSFLGNKTIYGAVTDNGFLSSNWQNLGTFMVRLFF